jgi:hypothetical protein
MSKKANFTVMPKNTTLELLAKNNIKKQIFRWLSLLTLISALPLHALNDGHDAQFTFFPQVHQKGRHKLTIAPGWHAPGDFSLHGGAQFTLSPRFTAGARTNFHFNSGSDYTGFLILGTQISLSSYEALQIDLAIGLGGKGDGVNISYVTARRYGPALESWFQGMLSMGGGLAGDNLALLEIGIYPGGKFAKYAAFHVGFITSTGVKRPIDAFALDLAPRLTFHQLLGSSLWAEAVLGVLGRRKEDWIIRTGVEYEF